MADPKAVVIELSEKERRVLSKIVRRETSAQRLVRRAQIILKAGEGKTNTEIRKEEGITRNRVAHWRGVWVTESEKLKVSEEEGIRERELERKIETILRDKSRPGAPGKFSAETVYPTTLLSASA